MTHVGDCCGALNISAVQQYLQTELGKLQKKTHKALSFFRFMSFAFMLVVITELSSSTVVGQRHRKRDWWYYRQMNMFPLPITAPKSNFKREASLQIQCFILTSTKDSIFVLKRYQRRLKIIQFIIIFRGVCHSPVNVRVSGVCPVIDCLPTRWCVPACGNPPYQRLWK